MPRETKEQRLTRELESARDINRNAMEAIKMARAERDQARLDVGMAQTDAAMARGEAEQWRSTATSIEYRANRKTRGLFGIIFDLSLKVARHEGYIARVADLDPTNSHSGVTAPMAEDGEDIPGLQRDIAGARSETMRDRILDNVDVDTLDRVLGRDEQYEDRFLRE